MKSARYLIVMVLYVVAVPAGIAQDNDLHSAKHHHYKLIDMGTFGGPQSYSPNAFFGDGFQARMLDNQGTQIGEADTSQTDPFNFCFFDCFVSHTLRAEQGGELTDLGALPGGGSSAPFWMSPSGLIAGASQNGQIDPLVPGFPELRAVLWHDRGITDLGTLEGGYESWAWAVNSKGQVAGMFTNTTPDANSMFPFGYQTRAFVWQDGVMQDLGTLGTGTDAWAFLINERGQVVGWSYLSSVPNSGCWQAYPPINIATGSFIWDKENGMRNLGSLGGMCTTAMAINNRGQVVGISTFEGEATSHGFLWDGSMHDLGGSFGGSSSQAYSINEAGEVVGFANLAGDATYHAALWRGIGKITDLGIIGGIYQCSSAHSINAKEQVVGESTDCVSTFHSFLWERGSIVDLNALIAGGSSLVLADAQTINDRGEIAGTALDPSGNAHAFLLVPCDEHHSGVQGCNYSIAQVRDEASVQPVGGTSGQAPPAVLGRRNNRFHVPAFGHRN